MQITGKSSNQEKRQAALSNVKDWCDPQGFYRKELVKLMGSSVKASSQHGDCGLDNQLIAACSVALRWN